jgi:predicted O-methyltransferase YrrM
MNKKENLKNILERIKGIPSHYYLRSLCSEEGEVLMLCNNIINNNVKNVVEIGTYKGVATAVFASIIEGNVYTINVSDEEIFYSKTLWESLDIKNITQIKGSSLDTLSQLLNNIDDVNFILIDGDHNAPYPAKEFEIILNSKIKNDKCFIYFHDGDTPGVIQAKEMYDLTKLGDGYAWMSEGEREKNKRLNGTLRYYYIFGDFNVDLENKEWAF